MPPSTLQRPSAFMDFSSPAPFWKFGSTPLRPLTDISPTKTPFSTFRPLGANIKAADEEEKRTEQQPEADTKDDSATVQSSSPPRPGSATQAFDGSPIRSRPMTSQGRSSQGMPHGRQSYASATGLDVQQERSVERSQPPQDSQAPSQLSQQPILAPPAQMSIQGHVGPAPSSQQPTQATNHAHAPNGVAHPHAHAPNVPMARFDEAEEDGIDLMK